MLAINDITDTSNQIDQYHYSRHDLRSYVSMRTSITSNTIIKAESQSTEVYMGMSELYISLYMEWVNSDTGFV